MKTLVRTIGLGVLAILCAGAARSAPLGTGFTYQGQLVQSGSPVTGTVTLRFSLWDAVSSGTQIGASQIVAGTSVTNGLFSVQLNDASQFGASAFNGDARWLQIEVCSDVSCSGTPTVLAPRQPITATPYARFAAGPWQLNGGNATFTGGNVGVGTTTPHAPLELQSGFGTEVLRFGLDASDYHFMSTGFHGSQPFLNYLAFDIEHGSNDPRRVLTLQGDGSVGIGTSSPQDKLDVRGNVKLGNAGDLFAPGGVENTRVVRGLVSAGGLAFYGSGFTSGIVSTGVYTVNFNTPFASNATMVATPANLNQPAIVIVGDTFTNSVTVKTFALNGTPVSVPFHFVAIGPR